VYASKKVKDIDVFVSYSQNDFLTSNIARNGFELLLNGNSYFENKTASLNNSSLTYFKYKKIEIGIINRGVNFEKGFSIGYITGENLTKVNIKKGELFTAEAGEFLVANWETEVYNTTPTKIGNGNGISINGFVTKKINKKSYILINIKDLGAINWKKNTTKYYSNDSINFQGIEFNNQLQISDSNYQNLSITDIRNEYVDSSSAHINTILPATFSAMFELEHTNRLTLNCGLQQRLDKNYTTYLSIQESIAITNTLKVGINIAQGGYSKFGYGAHLKYTNKSIAFSLNMRAINSLVISNSYLNASIFTSLKISI
jgi:hypothetical protein